MKRWQLALGFCGLMILDTLAHVCFKAGALQAAPVEADLAWVLRAVIVPSIWGAVACYVATFFVWLTLLRHAPIGPAFAVSHLEVVGVVLAGLWFFDEHVNALQWLGAGFVVTGIACLAVSENAPARDEI
jgi:drug/metabolite transporter (DMT)-like permease